MGQIRIADGDKFGPARRTTITDGGPDTVVQGFAVLAQSAVGSNYPVGFGR